MTGEKVRSLRKDHRPSKDEDLLEPDEEAATGTFTASRTNNKSRASKIFSNHKLIKSSSTQQQQQQQQNQQSQINANTNTLSTSDVIDDNNKNPIIRTGQDFPVHECVFKGDVRRLSSLIRTQNIAQKDVHGEFNNCSSQLPLKSPQWTANFKVQWSLVLANRPSFSGSIRCRRGFFLPRPR